MPFWVVVSFEGALADEGFVFGKRWSGETRNSGSLCCMYVCTSTVDGFFLQWRKEPCASAKGEHGMGELPGSGAGV